MQRARDWLRQAQRDLQVADKCAVDGYHEWAAFAAQQSAEKAVKALVQALRGSVRGHGVTEILQSISDRVDVPQKIIECAREIDQVYVTSRYPNGFATGIPGDYFNEQTSKRVIGHGREIVEFCSRHIH